MAKRYQIWNGTDNVITPSGEVFTPSEWIVKHPMHGLEGFKPVIAGGKINGAFAGELDDMVDMCEKMGCDFSSCTTDEEMLDTIEAFEDSLTTTESGTTTVSAEERIASALEAQVMMSMADVEETV